MPSEAAMKIAEKHYDLLGGTEVVIELRLHLAQCVDEGVKELVERAHKMHDEPYSAHAWDALDDTLALWEVK